MIPFLIAAASPCMDEKYHISEHTTFRHQPLLLRVKTYQNIRYYIYYKFYLSNRWWYFCRANRCDCPNFQSPIDILSFPDGGFSKMLFSKSAARMRFQIGLKSSRLFFTVESNSGLNFPRLQWSGMRNCTAVMSDEAFLQVCRISYVVMCYVATSVRI